MICELIIRVSSTEMSHRVWYDLQASGVADWRTRLPSANVNRKQHCTVMPSDVIRRRVLALFCCACAVNAHFNLYMNETETWRLLGKSAR